MRSSSFPCFHSFVFFLLLVTATLFIPSVVAGQDNPSSKGKDLYDQIKSFTLKGAAPVKELVLTRDRAKISFNGTFYFTAPIDGHVTGAVFVGEGRFTASVPPNEFEKD